LSDEQLATIRATVRQLVLEHGIDGWRISDLVARVGNSSRTLYKYFPTKEYLVLDSLVEGSGTTLRPMLEQVTAQVPDGADRVAAAIEVLTQALVGAPLMARAMVRSIACGQDEVAPLVRAMHGLARDVLAEALAGPDARPDARQVELADLVQQVWFASLMWWAAGVEEPAYITTSVARALGLLREQGAAA
jgi:AcrR family transcriptional regulator